MTSVICILFNSLTECVVIVLVIPLSSVWEWTYLNVLHSVTFFKEVKVLLLEDFIITLSAVLRGRFDGKSGGTWAIGDGHFNML